ncbi:hypothetical protein, partial [Microbulbifer taiwanensis]
IDTPRKAVASAAPEISSTINKTMYFFMSSNSLFKSQGLYISLAAISWLFQNQGSKSFQKSMTYLVAIKF